MRLKRILIILLMPVIAEVIIACCDCLKPVIKNYSNESITVHNLDNTGQYPIITAAASLPKEAYGISINLHREIVFKNKEVPTFFQSTYAFSCDCPPELEITAKDSIVSLKIFTVYDFDEDQPANSDISRYFKIYNYQSFTTIADYLSSKDYGYTWTLYNESELESEIKLLLMTAPRTNTPDKFRVQIILSDGRVFEKETEEINLI